MSAVPELRIREYTDPGCPYAWSAEPSRRRLDWLYGDQIEWELRMVGLAEHGSDYEEKGFTTERQSHAFRRLAERYHMPIDTSLRARMAATVPACRAVVAARRHAPERERALLRALRVRHFSGALLDAPQTLSEAAQLAGIEPTELDAWTSEPETEALLRQDLSEARSPTPEAVALRHKLAATDDGYRYTCPSYELEHAGGASLSVPGFQPTLSYEVAVANLMPGAARREDPKGVAEVLAWAGEPLATAEVAEVCGIELEAARELLGHVATERHLGFDGLWSL
jgi:predicted DsbA family dithiol-disulfide isomerase